MASNPVVTVKDGMLMGREGLTVNRSTYFYFKGIPYARPPLAELRFKAPEPPEPWSGVRDSSFERGISPQPSYQFPFPWPTSLSAVWAFIRFMPTAVRFARKMLCWRKEDCLYLNVYTPERPSTNSMLPVLFWIHGGAFLMGDGSEDMNGMDFFLERGVIVVVVNYRLGPFGFLSVGTEDAPGNAGLKDQVMALRWVRDNIAAFGGDPNRVTLYGVSAGASSAHLHTISPMSRGLFHAVISSSGVSLSDWSLTHEQLRRASEFAKLLDIEATSPAELVAALRREPVKRIVAALLDYVIIKRESCLATSIPFVPVIEPAGPGAFLTEHPEVVLREGRQAQVPFMTGVNNREGMVWFLGLEQVKVGCNKINFFDEDLEYLNENPHKFMPPELFNALTEEDRREVGRKLIEEYCGEKGLCRETADEFVTLIGDCMFKVKFLLASRLHAATSSAPVYTYHFSFDGQLGLVKQMLKNYPYKYKGAAHGDEMSYSINVKLFPTPPVSKDDPEWLVRSRFMGALVNFMKTGNPTPPSDSDREDVDFIWDPISKTSMSYLEMDKEFVMRHDKFGPRMQFWDNVYRKYLNKPLLV